MKFTQIKTYDINIIDTQIFEIEFFEKMEPLLLNNLDMNMPIYKKWTFDFFKHELGDNIINLCDDLTKSQEITQKVKMSEYIDKYINNNKLNKYPYMPGWSYQRAHPELDNDYVTPFFHPKDFINLLPPHLRFRRSWIFLGKKQIGSDLHVDGFSMSTSILMAYGKKIFRCFPPEYRDIVDENASLFDENDLQKIKKLNVPIYEAFLIPGTILYIPSGWPHQVNNETDTIMVSVGFSSKDHVFPFYSTLRQTLSNDVMNTDSIYLNYLKMLSANSNYLSYRTKNAIAIDLHRVKEDISVLKDLEAIYESFLSLK